MTRYLFSSLLLLLVSCALCGVVSVNGYELFVAEKIDAYNAYHRLEVSYNIAEVSSPSMTGGDDVVLGQVLAKVVDHATDYVIFTRFIEPGAGWPTDADTKANWGAQMATPRGAEGTIAFGTVKKGTNFYTLYAYKSSSDYDAGSPWYIILSTGAINGATGSKWIKWEQHFVDGSWVADKDKLEGVTPKGGTAFLIGEKPVFVLRGKKDTSDDKVFAIARMDGAMPACVWTFAIKEVGANCDAVFFPLDGKVCMAPKGATCQDKALKVLDGTWKKWEAATGDVAENLKGLEGKIDFVLPVNIGGKNVLLITEKRPNAQTPQNSDYFLHVAKGKYIAQLPRPIVQNVADISDASLFYAKGQLFFLSQRDTEVDLDRLKGVPEKIKGVVKDWTDSAVIGSSVNMGVVLLSALFGMLAPLAL